MTMTSLFDLEVHDVTNPDNFDGFESIPNIPEFLCTVRHIARQSFFTFVSQHESGRYSVNEQAFDLLMHGGEYQSYDALLWSKMTKRGIKVRRDIFEKFLRSGRADYITKSRAGSFWAFNHETIHDFVKGAEEANRIAVPWTIEEGSISSAVAYGADDAYNPTLGRMERLNEATGELVALINPKTRTIRVIHSTSR